MEILIVYLSLIEPPEKTPQQLSRESWLFPAISVPFNRWLCMPAAFIIQFCCGSLFTYIVFDKPIDKFIYGPASAITSRLTFYIAVALLGISAVIMGPWLERKGPKMASILGGFLFFFGNITVAIALLMKQMWLVYIGYGISAGYGIGLCFISPVSALQKWFPDRRGLASGIAVCGFGAGSLASAELESFLIQSLDLPLTFVVLGVAYFICIVTAGLILRTPPPGYCPGMLGLGPRARRLPLPTISEDLESADQPSSQEKEDFTLLEALGSTEFRLMYVMFFANLLLNLGTTTSWLTMITKMFGKSKEHAHNIVVVKGGFDLLGRICFPLLSDYIGRKNTYFLMLTGQLVILAGFYFIVMSKVYWLFVSCVWVVSACYGGGFGTLSVLLVEKFGAVNVGPCFGVIITAWSLAGITGGVSYQIVSQTVATKYGLNSSDPLPYTMVMWIFLGIVLLGWIALLFLKPTPKDIEFYKSAKSCLPSTNLFKFK